MAPEFCADIIPCSSVKDCVHLDALMDPGRHPENYLAMVSGGVAFAAVLLFLIDDTIFRRSTSANASGQLMEEDCGHVLRQPSVGRSSLTSSPCPLC